MNRRITFANHAIWYGQAPLIGAIPWLTYQDAFGNVVYGGTPLGDPPSSRRLPRHRG